MDRRIFRQKSLDQISSTEELHDYMHVTSPKLWMILSVILVLVVGFIVYASAVSTENSIQVKAEIMTDTDSNGKRNMDIYLQIPEKYEEVVKRNMDVRIGDEIGYITSVFMLEDDTEAIVSLYDENAILPTGIHDATIILEVVSPISFLFN